MNRVKPNHRKIEVYNVPNAIHAEIRKLAFERGIPMNTWLVWAITEQLRLATQNTKGE